MTSNLPAEPANAADDAASESIRGGALLLAGRGLSLVVNLSVQVLLVRYLSKAGYGSFAYALAFVEIGAIAAAAAMDKTVARFIPIYHERRQSSHVLGAVTFACCVVMAGGALLLILLEMAPAPWLARDKDVADLLRWFAVLAPLLALDSVLVSVIASLGSARMLLMRRYILGPLLRLVFVAIVVACDLRAMGMVGALIAAQCFGVLYSIWTCWFLLRRADVRGGGKMSVPARELTGYAAPLLASDVVFVIRGSFVFVALGWLSSEIAVAELRTVMPVARLNEVVWMAFSALYTPAASRLFADDRLQRLGDLYRTTSAWIALLSFPLFAASCCLAQPIVQLLFGKSYADASLLLAVMAFGYYVQASLGFNARTLKILGKVRLTLAIDLAVAVLAIELLFLLTPPYGALGAAIAITATMGAHVTLRQAALWRYGGVELFRSSAFQVHMACTLAAGALLAVSHLLQPPVWGMAALIALVSMLLFRFSSPRLGVRNVFPELMRIPVLRTLVSST